MKFDWTPFLRTSRQFAKSVEFEEKAFRIYNDQLRCQSKYSDICI